MPEFLRSFCQGSSYRCACFVCTRRMYCMCCIVCCCCVSVCMCVCVCVCVCVMCVYACVFVFVCVCMHACVYKVTQYINQTESQPIGGYLHIYSLARIPFVSSPNSKLNITNTQYLNVYYNDKKFQHWYSKHETLNTLYFKVFEIISYYHEVCLILMVDSIGYPHIDCFYPIIFKLILFIMGWKRFIPPQTNNYTHNGPIVKLYSTTTTTLQCPLLSVLTPTGSHRGNQPIVLLSAI